MYKILRGKSLRHVLPRIIVCAVLAIALLAVSASGLIRLMTGPKNLSDIAVDSLDGEYVSVDASEIVVAFATLSRTDSDDNTVNLKTYYLLPVDDGSYMAVMDTKDKNSALMDRAMEQSEEYYMSDLETLTKLGPVSGTVTALDDNMVSYMTDVIDNYELPGYEEGVDSSGLIVSWQINLDYVGFLRRQVVIILAVIALIFIVLLAAQLVLALSGFYQRRVRQVIGGDADRDDYLNAAVIGRVRVGKFIYYSKGASSRALRTSDVIWGYALSEPMVVSKYRWPVAVYDMEQKETTFQFMEQKDCRTFLDAIADQGHPFLTEYTSALADTFQNDFAAFQEEAEQAALAREAQKAAQAEQTEQESAEEPET